MQNKSAKITVLILGAIFCLVLCYFLTALLVLMLNKVGFIQFFKYLTPAFTFQAWYHSYPFFYKALIISACISGGFYAFLVQQTFKVRRSLFGSARFANSKDVKKMKLYGDEGIIIGKYNGKLLRFPGQQFVSLGAPTRSGKGVGVVIPNLLDWKESAVVQDIKQECFDYTSKYRQEVLKQEIYLFNPFGFETHRYNPLTYIDMDDPKCDGQLMDFAGILYPQTGDETTKFFNGQASNLFIGLCYLYKDLTASEAGKEWMKNVNERREQKIKLEWNLFGLLQLSKGFINLVNPWENSKKIEGFEGLVEHLIENNVISEITIRRLSTYTNISADNTRSGVMSSFNAPLTPFEGEILRRATEVSDFDLRDLRKKKMTIFIGITPDQLANASFILNLFWSQLILMNTKELPQTNKDLKYSCLLLMDEFTAPGQIKILQTAVSFIAGYNLRLLTIFQSISQLETPPPLGYGKEGAKTLLTNHACQIFYTPREQEDAEAISKILGNTEQESVSKSLNSSKGILNDGGGSRSYSKQSRALMLPQELRAMTFEEELVTIDNGNPIKCNKALYFNDDYFMNKFKEVAPSLKKIKGTPDRKAFEMAILNGETRIKVQNLGENNAK